MGEVLFLYVVNSFYPLIIIGIVGLVKKKSISIFFLIAGMGIALFMLVDWGTSKK